MYAEPGWAGADIGRDSTMRRRALITLAIIIAIAIFIIILISVNGQAPGARYG